MTKNPPLRIIPIINMIYGNVRTANLIFRKGLTRSEIMAKCDITVKEFNKAIYYMKDVNLFYDKIEKKYFIKNNKETVIKLIK